MVQAPYVLHALIRETEGEVWVGLTSSPANEQITQQLYDVIGQIGGWRPQIEQRARSLHEAVITSDTHTVEDAERLAAQVSEWLEMPLEIMRFPLTDVSARVVFFSSGSRADNVFIRLPHSLTEWQAEVITVGLRVFARPFLAESLGLRTNILNVSHLRKVRYERMDINRSGLGRLLDAWVETTGVILVRGSGLTHEDWAELASAEPFTPLP